MGGPRAMHAVQRGWRDSPCSAAAAATNDHTARSARNRFRLSRPVVLCLVSSRALRGEHEHRLAFAERLPWKLASHSQSEVIYASNSTEDRIAVFPPGACGDVVPARIIEGGRTGLAEPRGLSLDAWGRLHVANRKTATVTVYAPGAQGNAAPLRVLGAGTMHTAEAIAIGHDGDVFVASRTNGTIGGQASIVHFRSRSTHSDYTITGPRTGLTYPVGLALADDGTLLVANAFGGVVAAYAAGSRGDAAPLRSFTAATTSTQGLACCASTLVVSGMSVYVYSSDAGAGAQPAAVLARCAMLPLGCAGVVAIQVARGTPGTLIGVADSSHAAVHLIRTCGVAPALRVAAVASIAGPATGLGATVGGLAFA